MAHITSEYDIFLSYHRKSSQKIVETIKNKLANEENYRVWFDDDIIKLGLILTSEIEKGIRNSKIMICFINNDYCRSENCLRELRLSDELNMKRICVLLDSTARNEDSNGVAFIIAGSFKFYVYKGEENPNKSWSENKIKTLVQCCDSLLSNQVLPNE